MTTIPSINVEDVKKAIDDKKPMILLDVRTPGEYARGTIKGSINCSVEKISQEIESKISDKQATIYTFCLSGSRSMFAVVEMKKRGYANVFDMTNGLLAWRAKGFETV